MKGRRLLWLSICLGAVFWLCDAAVDVWLFEQQRHFLAEVFTSEPGEVRLRLVVWGLFAVIGYYGQRLIIALQTARDELQRRVRERTQELEATNIALSEEIAERKQTEAALKIMSRTVQASQERERQRIARELHDEVGQTLTMIKLNLQLVQDNISEAEANTHFQESLALTDLTLKKVRDVALDLRPSMLDDLGLVPTLRWYVDRHAQSSGAALSFQSDGVAGHDIPPNIATTCFRVVQEALTNIARHAQAHQVKIELGVHAGSLHCRIQDDGVGFNVAHAREAAIQGRSIGLLSMQEHAELAGGSLNVVSVPQEGSEIRARFPL